MKTGKARELPRAEPRRLGGKMGLDGRRDWVAEVCEEDGTTSYLASRLETKELRCYGRETLSLIGMERVV